MNCNNCCTNCRGASSHTKMINCNSYIAPHGTFRLAELALFHPSSLYKVLEKYGIRLDEVI